MEAFGSSSKKITSTKWSLIGLAAGIALGSALHGSTSGTLDSASTIVESIGTLWMGALQMIVIPLVVSTLFVAIVSQHKNTGIGRMAAWAFAVFVGVLVLGALYALFVSPWMIKPLDYDAEAIAALRVDVPEQARDVTSADSPSGLLEWLAALAQWVAQLVPRNVVEAFANNNILQIIIFTMLLAFAATRIATHRRDRLLGVFTALNEAVFVLVRWILWFTPLGVFALGLAFGRKAGLGIGEILLQWTIIICVLLIVFNLLLYPLTIVIGRVRLGAFARSLYAGQAIGASTRSSLAALPALMEDAKSKLDLPPPVVSFALPLSASLFKANRTPTGVARLLFLTHIYGIPLDPLQILTFTVATIILSFSTVGIPSGGFSFKTLPLYIALGVPIEGYFLLRSIDVIPDIFKTLVNVTGYMSATVILARGRGEPETA